MRKAYMSSGRGRPRCPFGHPRESNGYHRRAMTARRPTHTSRRPRRPRTADRPTTSSACGSTPIDPGCPATLRPMLPRPVAAPFDEADHLFEPWWGGERAFAYVDVDPTTGAGSVRIVDRRGRDRARAAARADGDRRSRRPAGRSRRSARRVARRRRWRRPTRPGRSGRTPGRPARADGRLSRLRHRGARRAAAHRPAARAAS